MPPEKIDPRLLAKLSAHARRLGLKRFFQSLGYDRSGELPLVVSRLEPLFDRRLSCLDIGSGDSVLPTFLLKNSSWAVTCVDKFRWVQSQRRFARRVLGREDPQRLKVIEADLLHTQLPEAQYDVITNISVIEHFEGDSDREAMSRSARLLKPSGLYLVTTPMNEGFYKEFYVKGDVYGTSAGGDRAFFQRHYDVAAYEERVIKPTGLREVERIYFGDYGFQFCEKFMVVPWPWKPIKLLYQWATPTLARRFLTYRDHPVSRPDMHMYTASGVFSVLTT
jgi:SAM-dependent methyltransferase